MVYHSQVIESVFGSQGCHNKVLQTGWLETTEISSHSFGGQNSEIRVLARLHPHLGASGALPGSSRLLAGFVSLQRWHRSLFPFRLSVGLLWASRGDPCSLPHGLLHLHTSRSRPNPSHAVNPGLFLCNQVEKNTFKGSHVIGSGPHGYLSVLRPPDPMYKISVQHHLISVWSNNWWACVYTRAGMLRVS